MQFPSYGRQFICLLVILFSGFHTLLAQQSVTQNDVTLDTLRWFDKARNRPIPVAIYRQKKSLTKGKQRVVIISHGYDYNRGGAYLAYSYLAEKLASEGFFVASIQHELPTDSLLPLTGIPQIVRRPSWERGADNILFVINQLKTVQPDLDFTHTTLIGHSQGGDMTALFPQRYPNVVSKIITLDNRRMALPRTKLPAVYSLRSSDQPADADVLPTAEEEKKLGTVIVKLPNTIHNNMDDSATTAQRKEINNYLLNFLKNKSYN